MKFVLVNGRTPYPQTFCMLRCESIKSGYLRATTTQYPYCDYECYSLYCESVARLREDLAGEESRIASRAAVISDAIGGGGV